MTRRATAASRTLSDEERASLLAVLDHGMDEIRIMRAHGWPLATPGELIPPAFHGPEMTNRMSGIAIFRKISPQDPQPPETFAVVPKLAVF